MGSETTEFYLGEGKDYYSQRNNRLYPSSTCNVTAMVQALHLAGYNPESWAKTREQPEDALAAFTDDPRVNAERARQNIDPWGLSIPNRQIHSLLSFATNLWTGIPGLTSFSTSLGLDALMANLILGHPVVISTKLTPGGHVVTLAGMRVTGTPPGVGTPAVGTIEGFFIDDPWGDYTTDYASPNGKKVFMKKEDFLTLVNQTGSMSKWGHTFPVLASKV